MHVCAYVCVSVSECVYMCACVYVCVFIGSFPVMILMNRGQLPTYQLHSINWGALDHASCAPQLIFMMIIIFH